MTEYTIAALLLTGALCFILGAVYGALVNEIGRMVRRRPLDAWYGGDGDGLIQAHGGNRYRIHIRFRILRYLRPQTDFR